MLSMDEEWICPICLDGNPDDCHTLVPCNHRFHTACLVEALRRNGPRCPYCRGLPHEHPQIFQNDENIQLVVNEIAEQEDAANPEPEPGNAEIENPLQQQVNDIINNNQLIFNMLENQINNQIVDINQIVIISGNFIVQAVINRELNNNLRQEIRNMIVNNINIFRANNNRELLNNFIINSNLNDDQKNFVIETINMAVNNFNENQENDNLVEEFVDNDDNVIIAENVINIFMNYLYQNIQENEIVQQLRDLINNNINIVNNNQFRENIINEIRNRNNVNINDRNNLINHINNIYHNIQQ